MKKIIKPDVWIPGITKAANVRHNYIGESLKSRCGRGNRPTDLQPADVSDGDSRNCARCQLMKIQGEVAP